MPLIANGGMISLNTGNTMDAIMLTKYIKYVDGVKLDVYKTIDDYFVLSNNDDLSIDTFNKRVISNSFYEEIRNTKFPSHIFKYYIPTIEDILKNYVSDKKIFLELHFNDKLEELYNILRKYPYEYYIVNKDYLFCDNPKMISINELQNKYIITKYPEKFYKYFLDSTNNDS